MAASSLGSEEEHTVVRWASIDGYNGRYMVSDTGRVYSEVSDIYMKLQKNKGYLSVALTNRDGHGTKTKFSVHVLVARAFIENPLNKATVNHKDGNRGHNYWRNLEWATHSENHLHSYRELGRWRRTTHHIDSSRPCVCIYDGVELFEFPSAASGARYFSLSAKSVARAALGHRKTCGCMQWRYLR